MAPPATLQISIPSTSTSPPPNPHTLYTIHLQLPIRTHILQKRYSDFTTLHSLLVSQTSAPPPAPLPPKSWLRRTVTSPALTESRRAELEAYLKAIVEAEDNRWRTSSAWREFLDLPPAAATGNNGGGGKGGRGQGVVVGIPQTSVTDAGEWLDVHREVKTQCQIARQLLKKREVVQTAQEQHGISAEAKAALVRAATGIARLEDSLAALGRRKKDDKDDDDDDGGWGGSGGKLGEGEVRRRRDMIGAAKMEVEALEASLRALVVKQNGSMLNGASGAAAATTSDKEALWNGTGAANNAHRSGRVLGGPAKETERTRELDNRGVLQLQKQVMAEQEQDVLEIGKAVSRMKEMGILINEELVVQNQMLDLMDQDVDRVEGKINVAKKKINKIS